MATFRRGAGEARPVVSQPRLGAARPAPAPAAEPKPPRPARAPAAPKDREAPVHARDFDTKMLVQDETGRRGYVVALGDRGGRNFVRVNWGGHSCQDYSGTQELRLLTQLTPKAAREW